MPRTGRPSRLSDKQVEDLRAYYSQGEGTWTVKELSHLFDISYVYTAKILTGERAAKRVYLVDPSDLV
jgi:transposase